MRGTLSSLGAGGPGGLPGGGHGRTELNRGRAGPEAPEDGGALGSSAELARLQQACPGAGQEGCRWTGGMAAGPLPLLGSGRAPEGRCSACGTPAWGTLVSRGQGHLPIPPPPGTTLGVEAGQGHCPNITVSPFSLEVLKASMEEEAASAEDHGSVLDLLRVPMLRWRTCAMLVVKYAVLAPPRSRAGTWAGIRATHVLRPHRRAQEARDLAGSGGGRDAEAGVGASCGARDQQRRPGGLGDVSQRLHPKGDRARHGLSPHAPHFTDGVGGGQRAQ